ncbi:MAG: cysteine--tRNA ligase [Myxococcales bacterium]|nr:MAG: cysteine--tRNA ligase [Myxococcales bacterium]
MSLSLYNTYSKKKEALSLQDPGHAKVYVCGPTVYDYAHLGHARCYVVYDVLVRHLRTSAIKVTYVRNITDVDDKIINRSKENNEDPGKLAQRFTEAFWQDMKQLGNAPADIEPTVSEHMPQIITLIETLIDKGAAYASEGDVYFSVEHFKKYGALSGRKLNQMSMGASGRLEQSDAVKKKNPADFALWKSSPQSELGWQSPWGYGRPGWHIECSTMSMNYLGNTLDLHGGGLDLVFPHHENEIAQSEAATGMPFANMWMHNGFVEVSKEKMSKSLGNFFTIREVFKFAEPEAVRFFVLNIHYRAPLNLDWKTDEQGHVISFPAIEEAERRLEYLYRSKERIAHIPENRLSSGDGPKHDVIDNFIPRIKACLDDDLNTCTALAALNEFLKHVNELADSLKKKKATINRHTFEHIIEGFTYVGKALGLGNEAAEQWLGRVQDRRLTRSGLSKDQIEDFIAKRNAARAAKDYAASDGIRDQLTAMGVELCDTPYGTEWRMI